MKKFLGIGGKFQRHNSIIIEGTFDLRPATFAGSIEGGQAFFDAFVGVVKIAEGKGCVVEVREPYFGSERHFTDERPVKCSESLFDGRSNDVFLFPQEKAFKKCATFGVR